MSRKSKYLIGIDIGGTKTSVVLGTTAPSIVEKIRFPTHPSRGPEYAMQKIKRSVFELKEKAGKHNVEIISIGISCGGPLDADKGIIMSPPNLPGWDAVPVAGILKEEFKVPVFLQNDANACALAEWRWGAGKGCRNMIFLTFGTGLGAGLILNGQLYSGFTDMAGEIGHIRLGKSGPEGYGKEGSFEGFCSGGGIAKLAKHIIRQKNEVGNTTPFCRDFSQKNITAKDVCAAAEEGDLTAVEILETSGKKLGEGLSVLIDILNPERIIIGSIFTRCRKFLQPSAEKIIQKEALKSSAEACKILPSALGDRIGDYGSLCVADKHIPSEGKVQV